MAQRYDSAAVEAKWRERWEQDGIYRFQPDGPGQKYYAVTMLPYPSGNLHIGHWFAKAPSDTHARFMRMRGYNVFFPLGFDAFGLPAENAAIKNNKNPKTWTYKNIDYMRNQLKTIGMMIDWDQEIISADPKYFRWNQWFFIQMYKRGLAYKRFAAVDWCPTCNTTLAREQVIGEDRRCERCDTPVIRRDLDQWFLKITDYADELLDFSELDWPERIVTMQRNWIGRSEGANVTFKIANHDATITVFTTRPDTLWGATFMVLAPEHPLVEQITTAEAREQVQAYVSEATRKTDIERQSTDEDKAKTGVPTGAFAINPATGEEIPIWIADYVLMTYGTGAIMAVPGHDERDEAFAITYNLPIKQVVTTTAGAMAAPGEPLPITGIAINSGPLDGLETPEAKQRAIAWLGEQGIGASAITYRLRDWLISRQRYWGTPIPVVYCQTCGAQPLPEDQLPLELPDNVDFKPTGESPLKLHPTWRFTTCPQCGGPAERDTDTMDTFVDSSWYQCRYLSPNEDSAPFNAEIAAKWLPVDMYTGGAEHAVMHLLYTRFWWKVMRDMGLVRANEPMKRLINQGIILGEDNNKMSKSKGNVVDPDVLVGRYGADVIRTFLMFIGPWEQGGPWNSRGIEGVVRFLDRAWRAVTEETRTDGAADEEALRRITHRTIKRVSDDIARFSFNTAIAALMEFVNELMKTRESSVRGTEVWHEATQTLALLLAPIAPHIAEEIWEFTGGTSSVHTQPWPEFKPELLVDSQIELPVQINGKIRTKINVAPDADEATVIATAIADEKIAEQIAGKSIVKQIVVPGKLVNIVVK